MKTIYLLQVDDKIIGRYTDKPSAGIALERYYETYGVKPLLIQTKVIGWAHRY